MGYYVQYYDERENVWRFTKEMSHDEAFEEMKHFLYRGITAYTERVYGRHY